MSLPGVLVVSIDGPHGAPSTHTMRFDGLGSCLFCDSQAIALRGALRTGRRDFVIRDHHGADVATVSLHRVTGVRVYALEHDEDFDAAADRKTTAAGG